MNKKRLLLIPMLTLAIWKQHSLQANNNCSCDVTSHTFFWVRPQYEVGSPLFIAQTKQQRHQADQSCFGGSLQATIYGGRSTNSGAIGRFFMPFCSPEAFVDGNIDLTDEALLPQHFNIFGVKFTPTTAAIIGLGSTNPNLTEGFSSAIKVSPRQSIVGLGLSYYQSFCFCDQQHWFGIVAPIMHVRNSMNLQESTPEGQISTVPPIPNEITNLNDPQTSMTDALQQSGWNYGKIDNRNHSKTRLGFIQIYGGHTYCKEDCYQLDPFIGITIPTGNTPDGKYVFEPIAGNANHWGFLWGASGEIFLWRNECNTWQLSLGLDVTMQYLLARTQKRSFDLKNGPWTRYIEMYANPQQALQATNLLVTDPTTKRFIYLNTPGINILTLDARVRPGFIACFNGAFIMEQLCKGFSFEAGYNFYAKEAECLSLKEPFITQAAIKDHVGAGVVNPIRDITENALINEAALFNLQINGNFNVDGITSFYGNGILNETDLNFASAAHPCILSHTIYGSLGYHWDDLCTPVITSIGGSYEFTSKTNTALNRWLVWGKLGISF